jgi:hypothetical protein
MLCRLFFLAYNTIYYDKGVSPMEELIVDLEELKSQDLTEISVSYMSLGIKVKEILKAMFGGYNLPLKVKGSKRDVQHFTDAVAKEKKYMDAYISYGLADPRTHKSKAKLGNSVRKFERLTGLKWPFSI